MIITLISLMFFVDPSFITTEHDLVEKQINIINEYITPDSFLNSYDKIVIKKYNFFWDVIQSDIRIVNNNLILVLEDDIIPIDRIINYINNCNEVNKYKNCDYKDMIMLHN